MYYFKKVIWLIVDFIGYQFTNLAIQILLARILVPEDFGKISIVIIFVAIFNTIFEQGYINSLLVKKKISSIELNSIFWFSFLLGIISYILIFFISFYVAEFYGIYDLGIILKVLGISIILNSLMIIYKYELIKNLDYKKQATITVVSSLTSGAVAVFLAVQGFGAWSLVAKTILMSTLTFFLMSITSRWRPNFEFSMSALKEHLSVGTRMMFVGIFETIYSYYLNLIVGKYYGVRELGYFTNAQKFALIMGNFLITVSKKFSLSVLPNFDQDKKGNIIKLFITLLNGFILPIFIFMYINSELIIHLLLGEKWSDAIPYFKVFLFITYVNILIKQYLMLLEVLNKSTILLKVEFIFKVLVISLSTYLIITDSTLINVLLLILILNVIYLIFYVIIFYDKIFIQKNSLIIFTLVLLLLLIDLYSPLNSIYNSLIILILTYAVNCFSLKNMIFNKRGI